MISKELKNIIIIALLLIYAHGIEEILTGFYHNDSFMRFFGEYFSITASQFYWLSHIIWWVTLPVMFLLVLKTKQLFCLMILFGSVFVIEIHHVVKGIIARSYYPGMITASLYPVLGIFYWNQLIKDWRKKKKSL